jgi:quercetin dioxygenase-like cupin family protein
LSGESGPFHRNHAHGDCPTRGKVRLLDVSNEIRRESRMPFAKKVELSVVDTNSAEWEIFPVEYIKAELEHNVLLNDEETGVMILKMVYRAGFTNPWHSHQCGHGFYILDGILDTHAGQYGPGNFVWFPEGGVMYHGATTEHDVTFLFITNKAFTIHFVGDETDPCALEMAVADMVMDTHSNK